MGDDAYNQDGDEDNEDNQSVLSKPPLPNTQEVPLPEVELVDLQKEDKNSFNWVSRSHAVVYDDVESQCDEDENNDEEDQNINKTSMSYLNKQKELLEAQYEQNKNLLEVEAQKKALGAKSD